MPVPENMPFSEFQNIQKIKKLNGNIVFSDDLTGFNGKKVYQYLFLYWISDDSIIYSKKKISKVSVNGNLLQRKVIFRQNIFDKFGNTVWSFHLSDKINNGMLLSYYHDKDYEKRFVHIFLDPQSKKKISGQILDILNDAAKEYGMAIKTQYVFYEYIDRETYKEIPEQPEKNDDDMFSILEIKPTDDAMEIKTAYRRLAKIYHPDFATPENEAEYSEKMKNINIAYEYLYQKYYK
ncbi:MAG: DnaJ domain-containing protein [Ferroplasma sp.]